jgi:signal transduction histidine kinase
LSFPRKRESSLFTNFWTPAFARVTPFVELCNWLISLLVFRIIVRVPATVTIYEKTAMGINDSRPNQTERFIAAGRVIMIAFSLFAVSLHPVEPVRHAWIISSLLTGYLVYATVLAAALWRLVKTWIHLTIVIHAVDLTVFTLLIFLTTGPASPFFGFFIFSLVCATLRWQWRGTLYTAATAMGILLVMAVYPENLLRDPGFEMDRFIIRIGYLPIVAALLGCLSACEQRRRETAAAEGRIRLCRDLHDGLLQSLTGAALQLETARRLMEKDPQTARQRIADIQKLIYTEQRDLRSRIRQLKTPHSTLPESKEDLAGRLEELAARIERQWGPRVELDVKLDRNGLPGSVAHEVYFIVHEAMINAARHAKASSIHAEIMGEPNSLRIVVSDNGSGFSFRGRHDQSALARMNLGPVTLRERVASLGGSLAIESGDTGACLEIALPIIEKRG